MNNKKKAAKFRFLFALPVACVMLTLGSVHAQQLPAGSPAASPLLLKELEFRGNASLDSKELLQALAPFLRKELDKATLDNLRQAVSRAYQIRGYGLVDVKLPPQDLTQGRLQVDITEVRLSKTSIDNQSATDLSGFAHELKSLQGQVVPTQKLERLIQVMKERPGIKEIKPTLQPAQEGVAMVDLMISAQGDQTTRFGIGADNYGSPFTGKNRAVLDFDIRAFAGGVLQGSLAGAPQALQSDAGAGNTNTGFLRYERPTGLDGLKVLGYHNRTLYALADALGGASNQGHANSSGIGMSYPLILEQTKRTNLNSAIEYATLSDKQWLWDVRKSTRSAKIGVDGFLTHTFAGSAAQFNYSLDVKGGQLRYQDPSHAALAAPHVLGDYSKLNMFVQEAVAVSEHDILSARWTYQASNKNLDPSERLGLTGPNSVRGFTSNVQSVDMGHLVSLEYKHRFQDTGFTGSAFYDHGQGRINHTPAASSGVNHVTLSSLGLGLSWSLSGWTMQAQWASKQRASTTLASLEPENQFWFSARYDFKN